MKRMRAVVLAALAVLVAGSTALAQATAGAPAAAAPAAATSWSFSASASTYILPDDPDYVQPAVTADRGWLHIEGRFNYEDRDTGSAWFGYNFSAGETVTLELTPMIGAVFGNTTGVAPGYRGSLGWRMLQLYSETEFVVDTDNPDDSFLYTWSELEVAPVDWCRFGFVVQRTKAYETEFDIQRGFFAGVSLKGLDVTGYVFNPDADRPTVVVTVGVGF
jgi:ABC-type transport system substrate-binding protein